MGAAEAKWSREEIEETFEHHQQLVVEIGKSWEWARYGELFTEDATYVEHLYGKMAGRDKISEWIASTMDTFPRQRDAVLSGHLALDRRGEGLGLQRDHEPDEGSRGRHHLRGAVHHDP